MKEVLRRRERTIHPNKKKRKQWPLGIIFARHRTTEEALKRKKRRRSKKEVKEAKVDHISLLPDHLLHEILSLLPYEKSIATTALSRRWRRIWQTLPDVSFAQSYFPFRNWQVEDHAFVNLVDSALRHRNHAVPVRSFSLRTESKICDKNKLYSWILYVTNSALQSLDLSLYVAFPFFELHSVFNLSSLRVLCLRFRAGCSGINWPATAFLPSLEKLNLREVIFAPMAKDVISNSCPILKDWRMIFSCATLELEVKSQVLEFLRLQKIGGSLTSLSICSPSIKTVMVHQQDDNLGSTHFKLSAARLQTLEWIGPPPHSTTIDSVPASLVSSFLIPMHYRRSYMDLLHNGSLSTTFTKLQVNRLVVLDKSTKSQDYANYFEAKGGFGRGGYWDSHGVSLEQLVEISIYRPHGLRYEYDFLEFLSRVATSLSKMTVTLGSYQVYPREVSKMIKKLHRVFPHIKILVL